MSFSKHNNYETPDDGTANWAASVNENFELMELGRTLLKTASEAISENEVMYLDTSGEWTLAIADGTVAQRFVGLAPADISISADGYGRVNGYAVDADWFFDPGMPVYLSAVTAGGLTTIAPTNAVNVGLAISTNEIMIRSWVEHGEIFGLLDDDHTQYLRTDSTRSTAGLTCDGTFSTMVNLGLGTIDQFGGGTGVMGIADASVAPTENPIGGGCLFTIGGSLIYRGSSGTTTLIANT